MNSLTAHIFIKVDLLKAYISVHNFDLICLYETYLNSSQTTHDTTLTLDWYKLVRADHPSDTRRGGVCIYFKECLPIKFLDITTLSECLVCQIEYQNKKGVIVTLYCSPNQNNEEFDLFLRRFEQIVSHVLSTNPFFVLLLLGNFNMKSTNWCLSDQTSVEGARLESLTTFYGLCQIISEPPHILPHRFFMY